MHQFSRINEEQSTVTELWNGKPSLYSCKISLLPSSPTSIEGVQSARVVFLWGHAEEDKEWNILNRSIRYCNIRYCLDNEYIFSQLYNQPCHLETQKADFPLSWTAASIYLIILSSSRIWKCACLRYFMIRYKQAWYRYVISFIQALCQLSESHILNLLQLHWIPVV